MRYGIVIARRGMTTEDALATALSGRPCAPLSVYVVGFAPESALALAFGGHISLTLDELDTDLALSVRYSERVGVEGGSVKLDDLVELAKRRVKDLSQ